MNVALSSLGLSNYNEVDYCWAPRGDPPWIFRTHLFPLAVDHFFRPDLLLLIVTRKVSTNEGCEEVRRALGERVRMVPIPDGRTENELWEIFHTVSCAVPENAEVILDVTHGFRSLPLLFYGVLTYLGCAKGVRLGRIVYGAHDARESGPDGVARAPVLDLTVLADLQEWVYAVDSFRVRSDAERLVGLLDRAHRRPWLARQSDDSPVPRRLQKMAGSLREFSRSLRLTRALDTLEQAARVHGLVREVEDEAATWAKPFSHILASVASEIECIAMDKPCALSVEVLRRQLALVRHYVAKDLTVQAVLLAREWLVNWVAWRCGETNWLDRDHRRRLEGALWSAARRSGEQAESRGGEPEEMAKCPPEPPDWYTALPGAEEAAKLWDGLTSARNDVAHCGMNPNPKPAGTLSETARGLLAQLENLLERTASAVP